MSKFITILTSAATLAMAAVPLSAVGSVAHAAEAHIQVADLDLSRPADARRFDQRVSVAAGEVCNDMVHERSQMGACRQAVREEAVQKLGSSQRQALQVAQTTPILVAGF